MPVMGQVLRWRRDLERLFALVDNDIIQGVTFMSFRGRCSLCPICLQPSLQTKVEKDYLSSYTLSCAKL